MEQWDDRRIGKGGSNRAMQQALREKDKDLQEIQRNMASWKKQQTDKLAHKFNEKMNEELEK